MECHTSVSSSPFQLRSGPRNLTTHLICSRSHHFSTHRLVFVNQPSVVSCLCSETCKTSPRPEGLSADRSTAPPEKSPWDYFKLSSNSRWQCKFILHISPTCQYIQVLCPAHVSCPGPLAPQLLWGCLPLLGKGGKGNDPPSGRTVACQSWKGPQRWSLKSWPSPHTWRDRAPKC